MFPENFQNTKEVCMKNYVDPKQEVERLYQKVKYELSQEYAELQTAKKVLRLIDKSRLDDAQCVHNTYCELSNSLDRCYLFNYSGGCGEKSYKLNIQFMVDSPKNVFVELFKGVGVRTVVWRVFLKEDEPCKLVLERYFSSDGKLKDVTNKVLENIIDELLR